MADLKESGKLVNTTSSDYGSTSNNNTLLEHQNIKTEGSTKIDVTPDEQDQFTDNLDTVNETLICGYTKKKFYIFLVLCLTSGIDTFAFSIISPFFPTVAAEKGLSTIQVGVIYSCLSLASVVSSTITGAVVANIGAKFILITSLFTSAVSVSVTALLVHTNGETFFVLSIACRIFTGISAGASFTSVYAIIFQEFKDDGSTAIAASESLTIIAGFVAPILGGVLYEVGGFPLPYLVLGGIQFINTIVCWWLLPSTAVEPNSKKTLPLALLVDFHALMATLSLIAVTSRVAFYQSEASVFLYETFNLNAIMIGLIFLISSVCYGISLPIWSRLSQKPGWNQPLMMISVFLAFIAGMLFGPIDYILTLFGWEHQQLWLFCTMLAMTALLFGGVMMPSFGEMFISAQKLNLCDTELATNGMVSGLWNAAYSVGDGIGPLIGGVLDNKFKFGNTIGILSCPYLILGTIYGGRQIYVKISGSSEKARKDDSSKEPLLTNNTIQ